MLLNIHCPVYRQKVLIECYEAVCESQKDLSGFYSNFNEIKKNKQENYEIRKQIRFVDYYNYFNTTYFGGIANPCPALFSNTIAI